MFAPDVPELFACARRLRFPPAIEALFVEAYHRASISNCRAALVVAFALYASFGFLDFWGIPSARNTVWVIRYLFVCPVIAIALIVSFLPAFRHRMQLVAALVVTVSGLGIIAMIAISEPSEPAYSQYYVGLLLVVAFGYTFVRLRLRFALASVGIVTGIYEVVAFMQQSSPFGPERLPFFMSSTFFIVSANILGCSACYFLELYMRRDFLYRRTIEEELIGARETQQRLLPAEFPDIPGLKIAGMCRTSREVGGDYFDVLSAGADRWLFVIADVSGKGAGAALVTANLHAIIRTLPSDGRESLPSIAARVNDYLIATMHHTRYVTAILAIYESDSRTIEYLNAGHSGGFLFTPGGERQDMTTTGLPLGLFAGVSWDVRQMVLQPGAKLLLYTDGIVERWNESGQSYDEDRLAAAALRASGHGPAQMLAGIIEDNDSFGGAADPTDDATMMIAWAQ